MNDKTRENGYFEACVNANAYRKTAADSALIEQAQATAREHLPPGNVRWAGSVYKGTAIKGSDLDALFGSTEAVTTQARAAFAEGLKSVTGRSVRVLRHVVRVEPAEGLPRFDVAFQNAEFGCRAPPDDSRFRERAVRGSTVRALKVWTRRSQNLPRVPGWALEALVVGLDQQAEAELPLPTFDRIVAWLATTAKPDNVLALVKPHASPVWRPEWETRLQGQVIALGNAARSLRRHRARIELGSQKLSRPG